MSELIERWAGKCVVVKYGGSTARAGIAVNRFARDVAWLGQRGVHIVVVHGGGPQIDAHLARLGIQSEFVHGHRRTTPEAFRAVRMVLTGEVQPDLVQAINANGAKAVGISGQDGAMLTLRRRFDPVAGDVGLVGDVVELDPHVIRTLIDGGYTPVLSGIGQTEDGTALNVNADAVAAATAVALQAERLVLITDVPGLYENWPESDDVLDVVDVARLERMLPLIEGGMAPKMEACLTAVSAGVDVAQLVDGREPHALLTALDTDARGTKVVMA